MRLFLGVGVSDEIRVGLAAALELWRSVAPELKWVRPELYHLTLQFVGDFPVAALPGFRCALKDVVAAPFRIRTDEMMTFPPGPRGRVLALALAEGRAALTALAASIRDVSATCGVQSESRAFRPHLTLARSRQGQFIPGELRAETLQAPILPALMVAEFNLYESRLLPDGPEYNVLEAFRLTGS